MVFNKEDNITIVSQEDSTISSFIENLNNAYNTIKHDHIIVDLFSFNELIAANVLEFVDLSNTHRASNKSFVLVTENISYDEAPEEISLAPTVQEAKDIIQMEEIERDLGL